MTSYDQLQATAAAAREEAISAGLTWTPLTDILATPPANWLIDGLIAAGSVNLMYGAPKAGKSLLILAMLKAVIRRRGILGQGPESDAHLVDLRAIRKQLGPPTQVTKRGGATLI